MSEQQHNGHVIPPETGALVPPHPQMYDIAKDEVRAVAQKDFDLVARAAEEGQRGITWPLRNLLVRAVLNMDRDKLRQVRKLFDDGVTGRPDAKG